MSTPTSRSLAALRSEGWTCCVVEKWVPASPKGFKGPIVRKDAFGFGDILAVQIGFSGAMLVQTTSGANVNARLNKIKGLAEAGIWLAAGNRIQAHGWSKQGPRGKRKVWHCRVINV